jgi:Polyketide cyclase / dehydrase and lipid transport
MKPYSVSVSTTVQSAIGEVHDLLDDLSAHERWTDHFLVDWELIGDPHGVGAKARLRAKGTGSKAKSEIEVIEATPTRIVEQGTAVDSPAVRTRGIYDLAPTAGGGTEITFTNEVFPSSRLEALGAPLAKAYLKRNNGKAMERLREILDGATVPA